MTELNQNPQNQNSQKQEGNKGSQQPGRGPTGSQDRQDTELQGQDRRRDTMDQDDDESGAPSGLDDSNKVRNANLQKQDNNGRSRS